jgi:predicted DsbA family dithiol-disulfide isomerase
MVDRGMSAAASVEPLSVDVVSDVVCPWCYLGKRHLEQAVAASEIPIVVNWRPFQLDATIPPEGMDRQVYMERKFGAGDRIRKAHEHLTALGAELGIAYAFDKISISPNTLDAHRLIRWAADPAGQDKLVEALFRAYFVDGRNIGNREVLADIAGAVGMDEAGIGARLATDEDRAEVQADIRSAQRIGVTGVPTFIVANRYGVVGAQPPEELARAFAAAAHETQAPRTGTDP